MKVFHARGFLRGFAIHGRDYPNQYDGKQLDELSLNANMTSRADVENVISYLEIHKHCFEEEKINNIAQYFD